MFDYLPVAAPAGRLARLGVVLEESGVGDRMAALGRLCDRAGIDTIWLSDLFSDTLGPNPAVWSRALEIRPVIERATVGVLVDARTPVADMVAAAVASGSSSGRLQIALTGPSAPDVVGPLRDQLVERLGLSRPGLGVVLERVDAFERIARIVDLVTLPGWIFPDLESAADEVRARAVDAGRDPATLGVAAFVTASVGRTDAEARARAEPDPLFARIGQPEAIGVFGALEDCQDRVIALAHAGITDLWCVLPSTPDILDVIAQLTAIAVGSTTVLIPGSLRSPAPPPPEGWGGRPDVPPKRSVSGGSRRR